MTEFLKKIIDYFRRSHTILNVWFSVTLQVWKILDTSLLSQFFHNKIEGVVNGKIEALRDGKTSISLCETETFSLFKLREREIWDFRKLRDRDLSILPFTFLQYVDNLFLKKCTLKNETSRPHCKKSETLRP